MTSFGTLLLPADDLRHRPAPGGRMRDSLFWEVILAERGIGVQVYLYLSGSGRTGYNVAVWGPEPDPLVLRLGSGRVADEADLADFRFDGLTLRQSEPLRTCTLQYRDDDVAIHLDFTALHEPFSYLANPDGLPDWFATNRMEQTGRVRGFVRTGDTAVTLDHVGHRDHSWGSRDWGTPQHWKWFVAYTPAGAAVNGWIWIARGEWGFGGYVLRDGRPVPIRYIDHHADYDEQMRQQRLVACVVDVEDQRTDVVMETFGILELPTHDPMETVIREAACRATLDGVEGAGQFETHWAGSYLRHLTTPRATPPRAPAP